MTPAFIDIENLLQQLSESTASDFTAIGVVDTLSRKIQWQSLYGSINNRTSKIKQHMNAGLTGEVLRTGSFLQLHKEKLPFLYNEEAIMLTEKLKHAAVWPITSDKGQYKAVVFIGKRKEGIYELDHIEAAAKLITQLEQESIVK